VRPRSRSRPATHWNGRHSVSGGATGAGRRRRRPRTATARIPVVPPRPWCAAGNGAGAPPGGRYGISVQDEVVGRGPVHAHEASSFPAVTRRAQAHAPAPAQRPSGSTACSSVRVGPLTRTTSRGTRTGQAARQGVVTVPSAHAVHPGGRRYRRAPGTAASRAAACCGTPDLLPRRCCRPRCRSGLHAGLPSAHSMSGWLWPCRRCRKVDIADTPA